MTTLEQAKKIVETLDEMKAKDLQLLQIDEISSLCDYFVLSTGTSTTAVKAQADKVEMKLKELGIMPNNVEGYRSEGWIILDYGTIIVHIFTEDARGFYDLDRLWQDGKSIEI